MTEYYLVTQSGQSIGTVYEHEITYYCSVFIDYSVADQELLDIYNTGVGHDH